MRWFWLLAKKAGLNERRFYKVLIRVADERFDDHLTQLGKEGKSP